MSSEDIHGQPNARGDGQHSGSTTAAVWSPVPTTPGCPLATNIINISGTIQPARVYDTPAHLLGPSGRTADWHISYPGSGTSATVFNRPLLQPTAPPEDESYVQGPGTHNDQRFRRYTYPSLGNEAAAVGQELPDETSDNEEESSNQRTGGRRASVYRTNTFHTIYKCYDLAFLSIATIVLALKTEGVREYDVTDFSEKSSWQPEKCGFFKRKDSVGTIDCLADERVVVGMIWTRVVIVLRRDEDRQGFWIIDQHIDVSPTTPYRISTWGLDLVACTGNRLPRGNYNPGNHLHIRSVRDSLKDVMYKRLDFLIYSVALTEEHVVVASYLKQKIPGTSKQYKVQAYNRSCILVWKYESQERICDIIYSSSRDLFYSVHHSGKKIRTMRQKARDAKPVDFDIPFDLSGTKLKPIVASADRDGFKLAVLNEDFREIAFLTC